MTRRSGLIAIPVLLSACRPHRQRSSCSRKRRDNNAERFRHHAM